MKFSRPATLTVALAAACGLLPACAEDMAGKAAAPNGFDVPARAGTLVPLEHKIGVLPGGSAKLEVRFDPDDEQPAASVSVEFAVVAPEDLDSDGLAGSYVPPDASLSPATPLTGVDGVARTELSVGSSPGTFRVRASTEGAKPVFFEVTVRAALSPTLVVQVDYDGQRNLAARSASALVNATCEQALAAEPTYQEVHTVKAPTEVVELPVAPGLSYAVVAWGRDDTGAEFAIGCEESSGPVTADEDDARPLVRVKLVDRPFRLQGNYPVSLTADVSVPMARVADQLRTAAQERLPDPGAEAEAYLDAVEDVLLELGHGAEASTLAARRANAAVDTSELVDMLAYGELGLNAAVDALGSDLVGAGERLGLAATLGVGALGSVPTTFSVSELVARSADGATAYALADVMSNAPLSASVIAEYHDARAQVEVTPLSLSFGLGSYGRALIACLAKEDGWLTTRYADEAGCAALASFLEANPSLSDVCLEDCRPLVCGQALRTLVGELEAGLSTLDANHSAINLRGVIAAHERTRDGLVDDLGPGSEPLMGNWGKALDAEAEDTVSASVAMAVGDGATAQ